jgi:microsomal dipeptidase-like Zn-dependent dipeptidase
MNHFNHSDWHQIHFKESDIVDLHAHPSLKVSLLNLMFFGKSSTSRFFNPFGLRTNFDRLKQGGVDLLLSTIYAPEREIVNDCHVIRLFKYIFPGTWKDIYDRPYFNVVNDMMDELEKAVSKTRNSQNKQEHAKIVFSLKELDELLSIDPSERPIGVLHNIEGAHSLDGHLDNLDHFFKRGVVYLSLAHFYANQAVHPVFPYPESVQKFGCFRGSRNLVKGLEEFGEKVIEKMIDLGMLVDITHCTPPARKRIYDIIGKRAPIIASHIGSYEMNPSPYNLKDWEVKKIADSGGLVGVIFMNYWLTPYASKRGINYINQTIQHFHNVGGSDVLAIGSDFDGFTDPPDDLMDAGGLPNLTQRFLAEGLDTETIVKIWGKNTLRVLRQSWGKKE